MTLAGLRFWVRAALVLVVAAALNFSEWQRRQEEAQEAASRRRSAWRRKTLCAQVAKDRPVIRSQIRVGAPWS